MALKKVVTASENNTNSFHHAISSVLVTAQCFGLLPILGITGPTATSLRFRWFCFRTAFSVIAMFVASINTVLSVMIMKSGLSFEQSDSLVFFGTVAIIYLLFFQLARHWPNLVVEWENLELSQKHYGYPRKLNLKIKIMTAIILIGALVEHLLSKANRLVLAVNCTNNLSEMFEYYFKKTGTYNQVFTALDYNTMTASFSLICNFISTFVWNFTDLFMILLSMSLSERFHLFNQHLTAVRGKLLPESFWTQTREEYNNLSYLTRTLDSYVSKIILVSFGSNLYFICRQLLNSLSPMDGIIDTVYFCWSFGFVLLRTVTLSLYAASIYDESRLPKYVLYAVPTDGYHTEVSRLLIQIATDTVALTGMNFFYITRTLLLTLAGTIVTYEIVLVQFNSINIMGGNSTQNSIYNATRRCDH